ncbi:MAG: peptidoglycan DD-metalloendopeptidase family protein [Rikenellaceae bacterium]
MKKVSKIISLLWLSLLVVGCGSQDHAPSDEVATVEESVVRELYGVNIEGYQLQESAVQMGETMGDIMIANGCTAGDVDRADRASREIFPLRNMRVGDKYTLFFGQDSLSNRRLSYIAYERDRQRYVLFNMTKVGRVEVTLGEKAAKSVIQRRVIKIESSLWMAINKQGIPVAVGDELEHIYQWSLDFFNIQGGDSFTVLYEERFVDDSLSLGMHRMVGSKFYDGKQSLYAIAFKQDDIVEFWDEQGGSRRMHLLKSPLRYTKVASRHSNARPSAPQRSAGEGLRVSYDAPSGSPVYSVADGVVKSIGSGGEDGNVIIITHDNNIESGYHHLGRFARGIDSGDRIRQGELVGYVGSSGDTRTPHLDYRLWVGGELVDPLSVESKPMRTIKESNQEAFKRVRDEVVSKLDAQ